MNTINEDKNTWTGGSAYAGHRVSDTLRDEWLTVNSTWEGKAFISGLNRSENKLINLSCELFAIILKISTLPVVDDVSALRHELINKFIDIKHRGERQGFPKAIIDKLCFIYAVVLDEHINYSDWSQGCHWENQTLLVELFGMRNGGELFFTVAKKALNKPKELIDLIEIFYLCIKTGFQGQYRNKNDDQLHLFTLQLEHALQEYSKKEQTFGATGYIKLPSSTKPAEPNFLTTTAFFLWFIGVGLTVNGLGVNPSHPELAEDFYQLAALNSRHTIRAQKEDIAFVSRDSDQASSFTKVSNQRDLYTGYSGYQTSPAWLVQLATFESQKRAQQFISDLHFFQQLAEIDRVPPYYRIIIRTGSYQNAFEIKKWYEKNEKISSIIFKSNQIKNNNDSVVSL